MHFNKDNGITIKIFINAIVTILILCVSVFIISLRAGASSAEPDTVYRFAFFILIAGVALVLVSAFSLSKSITKPIDTLIKAASDIADGNIDINVKDVRSGFGVLSNNLQNIANSLRRVTQYANSTLNRKGTGRSYENKNSPALEGCYRVIINGIDSAANAGGVMNQAGHAIGNMGSNAKEMCNFADDLSQGREAYTSTLNNLISDVEICAFQTSVDGKNATTVGEVAKESKENIDICSQDMKKLVGTIDEIRRSSDDISKISKVIEDIAVQTNMLALNASIEATRAGVHGKGFSVVADEVRSLASKSQDAAQEIAELVVDSVKRVSDGTEFADKTASSLDKIVQGINVIYNLMMEINGSTDIQAKAFSRVSKQLEQMLAEIPESYTKYQRNADISRELFEQLRTVQNALRSI